MDDWRSGAETAVLVGHGAAWCRRLHQVLGASSMVASAPRAVVLLDELSLEHAWHAELLIERLPRRAGIDRESMVDLGSDAPAFDLLEERGLRGAEADVLGTYEALLLPALRGALSSLAAGATAAAERPLMRAVGFIELDLAAAGERVALAREHASLEADPAFIDEVRGLLAR